MTTIYLIRHAEAEGNLYRRAQGQYNANLTVHGFHQLDALTKRFADKPIDRCYASDLTRAYLTAKCIADSHGLIVEKRVNLREIHMGIMEDRPWADLPRLYPELNDLWHNKPHLCEIPNGESATISGTRVYDEITKIAQENIDKTIVIASHGAVIRYFLYMVKGIPLSEHDGVDWCDNTAITKLTFHHDKFDILYESDNTHLKDTISPFAKKSWWEYQTKQDTPDMNLWFAPVETQIQKAYTYATMVHNTVVVKLFCNICG